MTSCQIFSFLARFMYKFLNDGALKAYGAIVDVKIGEISTLYCLIGWAFALQISAGYAISRFMYKFVNDGALKAYGAIVGEMTTLYCLIGWAFALQISAGYASSPLAGMLDGPAIRPVVAVFAGFLVPFGYFCQAVVPDPSVWLIMMFIIISGIGLGLLNHLTIVYLKDSFPTSYELWYSISSMGADLGVATMPLIRERLSELYGDGIGTLIFGMITALLILIGCLMPWFDTGDIGTKMRTAPQLQSLKGDSSGDNSAVESSPMGKPKCTEDASCVPRNHFYQSEEDTAQGEDAGSSGGEGDDESYLLSKPRYTRKTSGALRNHLYQSEEDTSEEEDEYSSGNEGDADSSSVSESEYAKRASPVLLNQPQSVEDSSEKENENTPFVSELDDVENASSGNSIHVCPNADDWVTFYISMYRNHPPVVYHVILDATIGYARTGWAIFMVPYGISIGLEPSTAVWLSTLAGLAGFTARGICAFIYYKECMSIKLGLVIPFTLLVVGYSFSRSVENLYTFSAMALLTGFGLSASRCVIATVVPSLVCASHFRPLVITQYTVAGVLDQFGGFCTGGIVDLTGSFRLASGVLAIVTFIQLSVGLVWSRSKHLKGEPVIQHALDHENQ